MYSKILVVVDGFANSSHPVYREALAIARASQAQLRLLHVLSPQQEQLDARLRGTEVTASGLWRRYERRCLQLLKTHAEKASSQGISADYQQVRGEVDAVVQAAARDWAADLIVVAHTAPSPAERITQFPCSTLFVKTAA